jgi:hypothetical protein
MLTSFSPAGVRVVANRAYLGNRFITDFAGFAIYAIIVAAVSLGLSIFQPALQIWLSNFFERYDFLVVNIVLLSIEFVMFLRFTLGRR